MIVNLPISSQYGDLLARTKELYYEERPSVKRQMFVTTRHLGHTEDISCKALID